MKLLVSSIALLFSTSSMAFNFGDTTSASASAKASARASAYQSQGQHQGQIQGQAQKQGNQQQTTINEAKQDYSNMYDGYVSAAYAPSVQPTVDCIKVINFGLTVPAVGSLSLGSDTEIDEGCVMRETVRIGLTSQDPAVVNTANEVLLKSLQGMLEDEPVRGNDRTTEVSEGYDWDNLGG